MRRHLRREWCRGRDAIAAVLLGALMCAAVQGTPTPQGEDIRDIRGPRTDVSSWYGWTVACATLVGAAGWGLWRWRRRRRSPGLSPYEAALQRLEASRALMHPDAAREFAAEVTGIVRAYIEQRFAVRVSHRTTEEFLRDLVDSSDAALARHRPRLADFLQHCDLVKFADASPPQRSLEFLHDSACRFVREAHDPLPAA